MSEKVMENNNVSVIGEVVSGFTFSHEVFGEGFYLVDLAVKPSERSDGYHSAYDIRTTFRRDEGLCG